MNGESVNQAIFRTGEIYQCDLKFQEAFDCYKKVLNSDFMQEKTLMRLAECCYRLNQLDQGLKYLDQLQSLQGDSIYTTSLLRGKYTDS